MVILSKSNIRILAPMDELDYFNSQSAVLSKALSPSHAWAIMTARPSPVLKLAFWLRDLLSAPFGVQKIKGFFRKPRQTIEAGAHLDFFLVEHSDESALVLTARARYLDVMTCISAQGSTITVSTSVKVHNGFGRCYMVPVGLAHPLIMRRSLARLRRHCRN